MDIHQWVKGIYAILLIMQIIEVSSVKGLMCYECNDEGNNPCKNFEKSKESFIKQCNSTDLGCSLTVKGNKRIRACYVQKFRDCEVANGIKYCFCDENLCNDKEENLNHVLMTDDEDLLDEGSGIKSLPVDPQNTTVTKTNTSSGNKINMYLPLYYFLITSILYK